MNKEETLQKIEERYGNSVLSKILEFADSDSNFSKSEKLKLKFLQSVLDTGYSEKEFVTSEEQIRIISEKLEIADDNEREIILLNIIDTFRDLNPLKSVLRKYEDILNKIQIENKK